MLNYTFDLRGWYEGAVELATLRSVDVAPPFIPNYPREVGKAWPLLNPDMQSWRVVAYEDPPVEIKPKNVVSKTDFMDLFGFPKLTEIQTVAQTDIEVKTAWEYGLAFNEIVVDHPKTLALLALLGTKQIGEKPLLTVEEIDKISHNQQIW